MASAYLCKCCGVQVFAHVSLLLIIFLLTYSLTVWLREGDMGQGLINFRDTYRYNAANYLLLAFLTTILFIFCLFLHELAHAFVASKVFHLRTKSITLWLFGGVADIDMHLATPR